MRKSRKVANPRRSGRKPKEPGEIIVHVPTYVKTSEIHLFSNSGDMYEDRRVLGRLMSDKWEEIKVILRK
jgi:hypothetical protein